MTFKEHAIEYCWRLLFSLLVMMLLFGNHVGKHGEVPEFIAGIVIGTAIYQLLKATVIHARGGRRW